MNLVSDKMSIHSELSTPSVNTPAPLPLALALHLRLCLLNTPHFVMKRHVYSCSNLVPGKSSLTEWFTYIISHLYLISSLDITWVQRSKVQSLCKIDLKMKKQHCPKMYIRHSLGSSRKSVHERPRNSDGLQVKWSVFRAIWLKSQDP